MAAPGAADVLKKEEEQLRSVMKRNALRACDGAVKAYVDCTKANFLSVVWTCRPALRAMNECLHLETTDAKLEELKADYARRRGQEGLEQG
eukprot:PRCOL_00003753-RA